MSEYQSFDLLTLGEIMLRLTPAFNERLNGGEFMLRTAGGAEMNVAAGVAGTADGGDFQASGQ